jgi:hypothetical protein
LAPSKKLNEALDEAIIHNFWVSKST